MKMLQKTTVPRISSIKTLQLQLDHSLMKEKLIEDETRNTTALMVVQFSSLAPSCFAEQVLEEMKKNKVKPTSPNFFLSLLNKENGYIKNDEILHSLIGVLLQTDDDIHYLFAFKRANGVIHVDLERNTNQCTFHPTDLFVVEPY